MRNSGRGQINPSHLSEAINDFHHARARASLQAITGRLRGKPVDLLSFDDVAGRLQVTGKVSAGRRPIPLEAIVGSVGRYTDFTRTFLPRRNWDAQRWAHVRAASNITELPPIDVYQIGDAYFVLDGNHRVSIARQQGVTHIDAIITTVHTRVPLSPHDDPDTLIVKTEHANFLAHTRLAQLRPGSDVRVSVAGQYAHLENLIEVNRYFIEEAEQRVVDDREAVARWYDDVYLPVVETIRDQGILRYFPNRTETDLYVFIATHQAELRRQLGWRVAPEMAAASLLQTAATQRRFWRSWFSRARRWLRRRRAQSAMIPHDSWSRQRVAARYSGQLFADMLVSFQSEEADGQSLAQALLLAQREGARVYGLHVARDGQPDFESRTAAFHEQCQAAGLQAQLACEDGPWVAAICRRAPLVDVVVAASGALVAEGTLETFLKQIPRPLLLVPGAARPIGRVLLYHDGSDQAREALFAATYMAEQWQVELVVLLAEPAGDVRAGVEAYLDLHELPAAILPVERGWHALAGAAQQHNCDLLVLGYPGRGSRQQLELAAFANLLRKCDRPLFVCT